MKKNKINIALIFLLLLLLVIIRFIENKLFYDPFYDFFKGNFFSQSIPKISNLSLFFSFFVRYTLNSIISISIIYLIFLNKNLLKFLILVYVFLFIILIISFYVFLYGYFIDWQVVFYVRRFIIQPLFLILFIPALFYQKVYGNDKITG